MAAERKKMRVLKSVDEIPEFTDEREEAEFWQRHSPVEMFDSLPGAEDVQFALEPKCLIPLPLDEDLYQRLRRKAKQKKLSTTRLIQRCFENGLREAR